MRASPNIPEEHLRACLRDQYGLSAATLALLPRGRDTRAGVYRVVSARGACYLLKVKSGAFSQASCLVPRYLKDQGIAAVAAPLPTTRGALWTTLRESGADWAAMLYPFIEGDVGWTPAMTDEQWQAVGASMREIHQVTLPPEGFASLRRETFGPGEYLRWIRAFELEHIGAEGGSWAERALREQWREHQLTIHTALTALDDLARALHGRSGPQVICHADLHPSNIIRDSDGGVHIVDWDDVMLAPKERDFLFVDRGLPEDALAQPGALPFFQGYGPAEIDWRAMTYFRWERAVQDMVELAQQVFLRDDLGEEIKTDAAQLFGILFAPGNNVDAARSAAVHLPPGQMRTSHHG